MSKLLQRLSDASKSGVYRAPHGRDITDALRDSRLRLARIELAGVTTKDALLGSIAAPLDFPEYFGKNWDALKDCLADLSWFTERGHVLVFERFNQIPASDLQVLMEILGDVAPLWAKDDRPFFAVFIGGAATLPELYKARQ